MSDLLLERDAATGVAQITIDRAEHHNTIGGTLLAELLATAEDLAADDDVRVVITAAAGRTWCTGVDLDDLAGRSELSADGILFDDAIGGAKGLEPGEPGGAEGDQVARLGIGRWVTRFRALEKPLIAAVDGPVAGGGLSLLLLHDLCVATPRSRFVAGFGNVGVGPEMGMSWLLPRLVGSRAAAELLLGAEGMDADRAQQVGLVNQVVPADELTAHVRRWAEQIAALPPLGVRATIRALRAAGGNDLDAQLALEWSEQQAAFASPEVPAAVARLRQALGRPAAAKAPR